ncbi:MAG: hypothetical protein U9P00_06885 [Pseudomonadota bacterium]|nr:hypothetical protein [Pseudomonadota bacterium]
MAGECNDGFHCIYICLLCSFVLAISVNTNACAGDIKTIDREIDPVIIHGEKLTWLNGHSIDKIRVFSFRAGKAVMIPFQIDQKDSSGNWVWDVTSQGHSVDDDDPANSALFDSNDELVFMSEDTGDRNPESRTAIPADVVVEIAVEDPVNQTSGWAYAAIFESDPPPLSPIRYMRYRPVDQTVISPIYEFSYSTEHIAVMDNLALNSRSIMDRTKIRGQVDWGFLFFKGSIRFNEESIDGYMEGYIDGPVRTVTRTVDYLRLSSDITTPEINCDHLYYMHHSEVPLLLSMNFPVKRVSMLITTDYRGEPFDTVYVDGIEIPIRLDTTSSGRNLLADFKHAKWFALNGNIGFILGIVTPPEELNNYLEASPYLLQDRNANNPPEAYSGSTPDAGFRINTLPGIPSGEFVLYITYLKSPIPFQRGNEHKLLNLINSRLLVDAALIE